VAETELLNKIDQAKIPNHIAIIMDGNGRWAKKLGHIRIFGHRQGVRTVKNVVETAAELGVKYLTLYAFSTENWSRPQAEVNALMELLVDSIRKETPSLMENSIKLEAIGDLENLPGNCNKTLKETINTTRNNNRMTLVLALNYSARWDLTRAMRNLATEACSGNIEPENITEKDIRKNLSTAAYPDPDLLIRTSGEYRISNFLLWEIAYSEIHITPVLWPDFETDDFYNAIIDYQKRERRFGKTSEQLIHS
jgi:undecaprenyl diphosphate synthase